jgi:thiamine-phosphate pyrophosphorylase
MAEKRARLALARAAARLAARQALPLPHLVLMTDDERLADPLAAAGALPRGSMVIVRARDAARREDLARAVLDIARQRALVVLVADDPALAIRLGADGLHLPEARARTAAHWRALQPRWLITVAAHGTGPVPMGADAIILSNIFGTPSHPDRPGLGPFKAAAIARAIGKPVYALGGIDGQTALRLAPVFTGIAAIGALS